MSAITDNKLLISIKGPMTKDYIDLNMLGITLINIQAIFDKSYCYYTGHKRISAIERNNFKITSNKIEHGSIIFTAGLSLFTIQQALPFVQTLDAKLLIDITFKAFNYLHTLLSKTKENKQLVINIINSPNTICNYDADNNVISTTQNVYNIAQDIRPSLRRIAKTFSSGEKGIVEVSSSEFPEAPILITDKNASLFQSNKVVSEIPLQITGIVKSYTAETFTGNFEVLNSSVIPSNKYAFCIDKTAKDNVDPFIESLKGNPITVTAFVEYDVSLGIGSNITRLFLKPIDNLEKN